MAPAIRFRSALSVLGRFPVLAGVDLEVDTGEVVLVRGPNGAGKTSLLRACAGLVPVISGDAHVLGHDLRRDRRAVSRSVGLLPARGFLYDDLTAEENVRFAARAGRRDRPGRSGGAGRAEAEAEVETVLARLGVQGRLPHLPASRLSTGQRRRVAIAALLVRRPALWLLDEPQAGLDAEGRELLAGIIREVSSEGAAVVFTSHEHDGTAALSGRVVTMAGGRIVADTAEEPDGTTATGPVQREPLNVA